MSTTRTVVIAAAKTFAQETASTPLLAGTADYDQALAVALRQFNADVPNLRVVHYTVAASAFRFVLAGAGAILSGLDAWKKGRSSMRAVWHPYLTTAQQQTPLDPNDWRVVEEPSLTILELLELTPSSGVLRLEFTTPHVVHVTDTAQTSVLEADVEALELLTAYHVLEMAARRAVQNTGNTGIPTDIVDRRSQSSEYHARAAELLKTYRSIVGQVDDVGGASATRDLDVRPSFVGYGGFLWKPRGTR